MWHSHVGWEEKKGYEDSIIWSLNDEEFLLWIFSSRSSSNWSRSDPSSSRSNDCIRCRFTIYCPNTWPNPPWLDVIASEQRVLEATRLLKAKFGHCFILRSDLDYHGYFSLCFILRSDLDYHGYFSLESWYRIQWLVPSHWPPGICCESGGGGDRFSTCRNHAYDEWDF